MTFNSYILLSLNVHKFAQIHTISNLCVKRCMFKNLGNINKSATKYFSDIKEPSTKQVYYGLLTPQIKSVKIFSVSSSIVGIVAQPFLYTEIVKAGNIPTIVAAYSFIGFFTFITPLLLHMITKKYVTHLSYNKEKDVYIAKTVNFFCMTQETEFKIDDVKVPDVAGMFTTLYVKKKALFLDPRMFEEPEHYTKLMGYDKPIDLKLYDQKK